MARLGFGGFETQSFVADGLAQTGTGGSTTYNNAVVHTGTRSRKLLTVAGSATDIAWVLNLAGTAGVTYYGKVWVNFDALPGSVSVALVALFDGTFVGAGVVLNTDGTMTFNGGGTNRATSPGSFATNTWHCLEVRGIYYGVSGTGAGQGVWAEVRVNGTSIGSFQNVASGATGRPLQFRFGAATAFNVSNAFNIYFDDWAVNDDTGSANTSWVGTDEVCALLLAISDNTIGANWKLGNNTAPSSNAFDSVNNTPPTGKALASGLAGDQLRNAVTPTGVAADEFTVNLQSPTAAGVPAGQTVTAAVAFAMIGSSSANSQQIGIQQMSNPAIAEAVGTSPAAAAGTFSTNWSRIGVLENNPTGVALGTSPAVKLRWDTRGGTGSAMVCFVATYVAYVPSATPSALPIVHRAHHGLTMRTAPNR